MGKRAKVRDFGLTPEETMVYGCAMAGIPIKELSDLTGKSRGTIYAWIEKVRKYAEESGYNVEEYRKPIDALYPLWLRSVIMNLKANDTQMTIAIGKGRQWLVEKQETKNTDDQHDEKPTDDLKQEIVDILDKNSKKAADGE